MPRWFICVLLCALPSAARAQSLVITGGASSLFEANGGGITYYSGNSQADVGLGLFQNRFAFGADYRFKWRACTFAAGDYSEYLSVIGAGLSVANRGIAAECQRGKDTIRFFTGAIGEAHAVPFFTATSASHFGSGISFERHPAKDFEIDAVAALAGNQRVFLEGVKYKWRGFHFDEAAGRAQGAGYFQGDAAFQARHFAVQVSHVDYLGLTSYTGESGSIGAGPVSGFASAFQSPKFGGQAFGGQIVLGAFATNVFEMRSQGRFQTVVMESEHYRHFVTTQFVSHSGNSTSASFGGGYTGNLLSGSVSYQEVFNPLGGFQRATVIAVGIQLPRLTLHLSLDVLPSGVTYSGWGSAYVRGPALATGSTSPMAE